VWFSIPLAAVQTAVAKRVAEDVAGGAGTGAERVVASSLRAVFPVTLAGSVALCLMSPILWSFLRLESPWTVVLIALYLVPAGCLAVLRGTLQGAMSFGRLALVTLVPTLVRLGAAVWLVKTGGGVAGAVAASALAEWLGVLLGFFLLARAVGAIRNAGWDRTLLAQAMPLAVGLGGMWLLIQLDLLVVRHLLSPGASGEYAAAGLLARAVLFVPAAISLVALPHFSRSRWDRDGAFGWLLASAVTTVALCLPIALGFVVYGDEVVAWTFGLAFEEAARILPLMSFGMIGFAVANLLLYFHVAVGSRVFYLLWPWAVVEGVILLLVAHPSPQILAAVMTIGGWTVTSIGLVTARAITKPTSTRAGLPSATMVRSATAIENADRPYVSLVLPLCDGEMSAIASLRRARSVLDRLGRSFEIIVIADGSALRGHSGLQELARFADVLHYARRQGKGMALRLGMAQARGRYVAFIDADGDIDAECLIEFLLIMENQNPHLVLGSKRHPDSVVDYPLTRRSMSRAYHAVVRSLFGLRVTDTQTGIKMIRKDVLEAVLPRMLEKRFAFDLEFLVVAKRLGFDRFAEAPVHLTYRFRSTLAARDVYRIGLDTLAVYYRRYILRTYDVARAEHLCGPGGGLGRTGGQKMTSGAPLSPEASEA
jgi:O-antigen/teichoic acid export membrane protein